MPVADMLVDAASRQELVSTLDGFAGYHQIKIDEGDRSKTAFRCPGSVGLSEYVDMPFGLKNTGATYQRAMNLIFDEMIGYFMEIYIDEVLVKSGSASEHEEHLVRAFERMRRFSLKMNPLKCVFGVKASNFLGFLVHKNGIEIDQNKAKAILKAQPPQTKREFRKFLGQINYVRRFVTYLVGKTKAFSPLLKLKKGDEFKWSGEHQQAFVQIKAKLASPPVLIPPKHNGKPLRLYLSASDGSNASMLTQENEHGQE